MNFLFSSTFLHGIEPTIVQNFFSHEGTEGCQLLPVRKMLVSNVKEDKQLKKSSKKGKLELLNKKINTKVHSQKEIGNKTPIISRQKKKKGKW